MKGRERGPAQVRDNVGITEHMGLLAGGIRLEILVCLAESPKDVTGLADELGLAVNHVSQGLRLLREHGLVEVHRDRRNRIHQLGPDVHISVADQVIRLGIRNPSGEMMLIQTPAARDRRASSLSGDSQALLDLAREWFAAAPNPAASGGT